MFSGYSLAWHVPWALRDAPQRTISAMHPPWKTPQAPRQQPLARRFGSSEESAVASRRKPSEVRCGHRRICKMHYELPGGSARCKISPAATATPKLVDSRSRPMGLPPVLLTCQELNRAHPPNLRINQLFTTCVRIAWASSIAACSRLWLNLTFSKCGRASECEK